MTQQEQAPVLSRKEKNEILVSNAVVKWKLSQRDGERCNKCKTRMYPSELTIDHIIPKFKDGSDELSNKQLLCISCHRKKTKRENIARAELETAKQEQGVAP
jgi:5-methylcytosine-specific restriction endonuclease McrA